MTWFQRLLHRPFFIRLLHWEYWSFNTVYIPIYLVWLGLCLRARSLFFFAASNPGIKNGGFLNESKKEIFPLIPSSLHPATVFFSIPACPDQVCETIGRLAMSYPLIGKPDVGGRGRGVKILRNSQDLVTYVRQATLDFHIQEFVPYEMEAGIFYYRYPHQETGRISGIVGKDFLQVTGDGKRCIRELISTSPRAILQKAALQKEYGEALGEVLAEGTRRILVPYGNHARGAMFTDESGRIDEALTDQMDAVCRQIPGFYFGRLDIRFKSWEDLRAGRHFSILEVNGAGSEPTHIYDPGHSLFFAWKEIIRHWVILFRISRQNHRLGIPYLSFKEGIHMFREDKIISAKLAEMTP